MTDNKRECDCDWFDEGYTRKVDNNSYNSKDVTGRSIMDRSITSVVFLLSAICIGITLAVLLIKNPTMTPLVFGLIAAGVTSLIITGATGGTVISELKKEPLRAVYAVGEIIARTERTPPVLDTNTYFPESKEFEEAHPIIKEEVAAVAAHMDAIPLAKNTFGGKNTSIGRDVRKDENGNEIGWRVMMVSLGDEISEDAKKFCPTLVDLVKKNRDKIMSCAISILPPKTSIPQHHGYYKGVLRYMLAVDIPEEKEKVYLCANDTKVHWEEGKSIMFDDTFPHKVYNHTDDRRIVLYMDIKRPLGGTLGKINRFIIRKMQESNVAKDEIRKTERLIKLPDVHEEPEVEALVEMLSEENKKE